MRQGCALRGVIRPLLGILLAGSANTPLSAGDEAMADPFAGWERMAPSELARQAGGAASFSVAIGDLLVNHSDIAANVAQTTITNVTAGGIGGNAIGGLDGLSTIVFNTGSAVSTAISYQLNVVVK